MAVLNIAAVSSRSHFCDKDRNLRHFASIVERSARKGSDLICFPELALTSYCLRDRLIDMAESIPGPSTDALARIAARNQVYISMGMPEKAGDACFIAQVIVGPDGYIGRYRKHHPTSAERELGFSAGESFPVFRIKGFDVGVNICIDGRHRDTIEPLRNARVDAILHPFANELNVGENAEDWAYGKVVYFAPRAIYARAYVVINNSAEDTVYPEGVMKFSSGALVVDPLGQVLVRTQEKTRTEKMVTARLVKPLSQLIPEFEMRHLGKDSSLERNLV